MCKVAVLGPLGTYTHEAAYRVFGESVTYEEQRTIADVFRAVQDNPVIGVVPQENTIFGSVAETYCMLQQADRSGFVKGEVTLKIQHCLLAQHGVKLHEIEEVLSHEQALGQCQSFLNTHLPSATRIKTCSTALAAREVSSGSRKRAAICSKICATLFEGLEVLCEGIQRDATNFTRFYIIVQDAKVRLPETPQPLRNKALLRMIISQCPDPMEHSKNIVEYLAPGDFWITHIDRRPSEDDVPFKDVYFVEIMDKKQDTFGQESGDSQAWLARIKAEIDRIKVMGGEVDLIGYW